MFYLKKTHNAADIIPWLPSSNTFQIFVMFSNTLQRLAVLFILFNK